MLAVQGGAPGSDLLPLLRRSDRQPEQATEHRGAAPGRAGHHGCLAAADHQAHAPALQTQSQLL